MSANTRKREAASLFSKAERSLQDGNALECAEVAEEALEIFRGLGVDGQTASADTLRLLVEGRRQHCLQVGEDPTEVKKFAEEERRKFEEAQHRRGEALMLISLAEIALDLRKRGGQFPTLQPVEKALEIVRTLGDKRLEGIALLTLSDIHLARFALVEAKTNAESAAPCFEDLGDRVNKARAVRNIARTQLACGKLVSGEKMSQEAVEIFREENARRLEAEELQSLSTYLLAAGKPKAALLAAERGLTIFRYLACPEAEEAQALLKVSQCLLRLNKGQTALTRGREAASRFQVMEARNAEAMAMQVVAQALLQIGKKKEALLAAQEAQEVAANNESLKALAMKDEAFALMAMDDYDEAIRRVQDASTLAAKANDLAVQAGILREAAQMHMNRGNFKEALSSAREACEASERFGDKHSMALALETVGMAQGVQGNLQQAVTSAQECQELYQETGNPLGEEKALELLAKLKAAQGRIQDALEAGEERLSVVRDHGNMSKEADALHQVAGLHFQGGNIAVAERTVKEARALAKKAGSPSVEAEVTVTLAQIHLEKGEVAGEAGFSLAARLAADAVSVAGKARNGRVHAQALLLRGKALLKMSRRTDAWRCSSEAAHKYQELGDGQGMCRALLVCGEIKIDNEETSTAKDIIEQALDIATQCGESELAETADQLLQRLKPKAQAVTVQIAEVEEEAQVSAAAPTAVVSAAPEKPKGLDPVFVRKQVLHFVKDAIADDDDIEIDSPFMEAGMDSLSSVSLTSMLAKEFGMALSPSLVFDFPTVRALEAHLVEESMNQ